MKTTFARYLAPSFVHKFFQRGSMGVIILLSKVTGIMWNKRTEHTAMLNKPLFYSSLAFI